MSDSEKLRKIKGNIWLYLSFFIFAITICFIWFVFVEVYLIFFLPIYLFFFGFSIIELVKKAYDKYVGVSEEEINNFDSAKLLKTNGIIYLVGAFIFLALAISSIWIFVIFSEFFSQILPVCIILFSVFIAFFIGFTRIACSKFIKIEKIIK